MPEDIEPTFVYKRTKLSGKFQMQDRTKDKDKHIPGYHAKCPKCDKRKTERKLKDRVDEDSGKDSKSNILRQS